MTSALLPAGFHDRLPPHADAAARLESTLLGAAFAHGYERVDPALAGQLFKPFSMGDSSYTRKEQGAGLGLAVTKRIVEQAGGAIGFDSQPGEGAQFFFTLPVSGLAHSAAGLTRL